MLALTTGAWSRRQNAPPYFNLHHSVRFARLLPKVCDREFYARRTG
jgi:hypothetical protein